MANLMAVRSKCHMIDTPLDMLPIALALEYQ